MKVTKHAARSRFDSNPYWRSPHLRAEGISDAEESDAEHTDAIFPRSVVDAEELVADVFIVQRTSFAVCRPEDGSVTDVPDRGTRQSVR